VLLPLGGGKRVRMQRRTPRPRAAVAASGRARPAAAAYVLCGACIVDIQACLRQCAVCNSICIICMRDRVPSTLGSHPGGARWSTCQPSLALARQCGPCCTPSNMCHKNVSQKPTHFFLSPPSAANAPVIASVPALQYTHHPHRSHRVRSPISSNRCLVWGLALRPLAPRQRVQQSLMAGSLSRVGACTQCACSVRCRCPADHPH
jgi:hypothetical protein